MQRGLHRQVLRLLVEVLGSLVRNCCRRSRLSWARDGWLHAPRSQVLSRACL